MNYETNRLNTFNDWPSSAPVDPIRIAKAGFFYTGDGTEVQCFSCGGKISQWNYGDQVMWRHRRLDPNCPFVMNPQISGNVPLLMGSECPTAVSTTPSQPVLEGHPDSIDTPRDQGPTEEDEMYKNDALRLLSFANWDDSSVTPWALVSAGFYHAGEGRLRCAWCGGELTPFRRFGSVGRPLEVHRMYFPRCEHAASLEAAQRSSNIASLSSPPTNSLPTNVSPTNSPPVNSPPVNSPPANLPPVNSPPQNSSPSNTPPSNTRPTQTQSSDNRPQPSGAEHNERVLNMGGAWRELGVVSGGARHPQYASLAARLASFERWPADRQQEPRTLAEAGFYHTGMDDQVRCFYCDGGLGKWEAGDTPWSEHAHWFPHCGYVLLVKGQDFVDTCRNRTSAQRTVSAEGGLGGRLDCNDYNALESALQRYMENGITLAVLEAGMDAARVRRAIVRRLQRIGCFFSTSDALIDAVLDEQLNEENWDRPTNRTQRFARDILAEVFGGGVAPGSDSHWEDRPDSARSQSDTTRSPSPESSPAGRVLPQSVPTERIVNQVPATNRTASEPHVAEDSEVESTAKPEEKKLSLEEENRQLKEARLCKVCMDCEVSVVFLPCGHLVSCSRCGAALDACPLCRAGVRALVRAYLA